MFRARTSAMGERMTFRPHRNRIEPGRGCACWFNEFPGFIEMPFCLHSGAGKACQSHTGRRSNPTNQERKPFSPSGQPLIRANGGHIRA